MMASPIPDRISIKHISPELGRGGYGVATIIEIKFGDATLPAVIKQFHPPESSSDEHNLSNALKGYQAARSIGLKTPEVYMPIKNNRAILMPFIGAEDSICVGPNNPGRCSIALWGLELLDTVPNLQELWKQMMTDAMWAGAHRLRMENDAQFFLWNTKDSTLDYVWADFDNVAIDTSRRRVEIIQLRNIKSAYAAIDRFLQVNIKPEFIQQERTAFSNFVLENIHSQLTHTHPLTEFMHQFGNNPLKRWTIPAPAPQKDIAILRYPSEAKVL